MLNVIDAITQIRSRVHDREGITFEDAEIFEVMDNRLKHLTTKLRTAGDARGLDYVEVAVSSMTVVQTTEFTYQLPEWITDIQLVEGMQAGQKPKPFVRVSLEEKETGQLPYVWHFGRRGLIHVKGSVGGFSTVRVWFVRTLPPLFYSTVTSGTALQAVLNAPTAFVFKDREGLYDSFLFEITSHAGFPANVGQVRRCSTYSAKTLVFDTAWPAAITATTILAMCIPLDEEFHEYFITLCVKKLFERTGSADDVAIASQDLAHLEIEFESGIARRSTGEPPRLVSSRRFGR